MVSIIWERDIHGLIRRRSHGEGVLGTSFTQQVNGGANSLATQQQIRCQKRYFKWTSSMEKKYGHHHHQDRHLHYKSDDSSIKMTIK